MNPLLILGASAAALILIASPLVCVVAALRMAWEARAVPPGIELAGCVGMALVGLLAGSFVLDHLSALWAVVLMVSR